MLNESQYKCRRTKQCILTLLTTEPRDEDGETGRQALPYRSAERGLYSREPWERAVAKSGTDFAICK